MCMIALFGTISSYKMTSALLSECMSMVFRLTYIKMHMFAHIRTVYMYAITHTHTYTHAHTHTLMYMLAQLIEHN